MNTGKKYCHSIIVLWHQISEEAKTKLKMLYQFFCGLHLMIGIADAVNATLSHFEKLHCTDTCVDDADDMDTPRGEEN